jgi:hypothetical protein
MDPGIQELKMPNTCRVVVKIGPNILTCEQPPNTEPYSRNIQGSSIAFKKSILGFRLCNPVFLDRYSIANHKSTIANPI